MGHKIHKGFRSYGTEVDLDASTEAAAAKGGQQLGVFW